MQCLSIKEPMYRQQKWKAYFPFFFSGISRQSRAYRHSEAYLKAIRKRSLWVEPLFGEAKEFHGLRRFRLRRLRKVNIEGVMVAAGQNLKRLIKHNVWYAFSFLKFTSSCLISPLFRTFSTGCNLVRTIFPLFLSSWSLYLII
jgi:hypothetical protein